MPDIGIIELIIIALIAACAVAPVVIAILWLVRRGQHKPGWANPWSVDSATALLRDRYARGEIDAAEFEERKRTLGG